MMGRDMEETKDFEELFKNTYVPLEYKMLKNDFEEIVKKHSKNFFNDDFPGMESVTRDNYAAYLDMEVYGELEDCLDEAFGTVNQDLLDIVMEIGSNADYDSNAVSIYYDEMDKLMKEFLGILFDTTICRMDWK